MAGTISSLGIGSGVLTADVLDQLRANDEAAMITPLDRRIAQYKSKSNAYASVKSLLEKFQTAAANLGDPLFYTKRTTTVEGIGASVTSVEGTAEQSFTLVTNTLAKKAIMESSVAAFAAGTDLVSQDGTSGTYDITVNGATYNIAYDSTTTLDSLVSQINTTAGADVTASTLQVANGDVRLVLTSNATGSTQGITTADSGTGLTGTGLTGMTQVQPASDASFTFNGIAITRSTNEITDLVTGATVTLLKEGETTSVNIAQDKQAIEDGIKSFVDSYNTLVDEIKRLTAADPEAGTAGALNGDSFIRSITRQMSSMLNAVGLTGETIADYGMEIDRYGKMSLDSTAFMNKYNADPANAELFLVGDGTSEGMFKQLDTQLETYLKYNGLVDTYANGFSERIKDIEDQRARALELLDKRYESMTSRFIAYDSMINRMNSSFGFLQQQILMATSTKNS